MDLVGTTTSITIWNKSRRRCALLLALDIDEDERDLAEIADTAARTAYDPKRIPKAHAELAEAVLQALTACEAMPGEARGTAELPDGRLVETIRNIG